MALPLTNDTRYQDTYRQRFSIQFDYPVIFTRNVFDPTNQALARIINECDSGKPHRCIVFADDGVIGASRDLAERIGRYADEHANRMELVAPPFPISGGEDIKNDPLIIERIQESILKYSIDRHSYVIAVGGGAVLDTVGFAAATAHRGIRHIRIPTTVLSQNDSGIGVKNGINFHGVKNFTGAFAPPSAVLIDSSFLETLPPREKIAGMAEAVKVALIRDREFFHWLERNADALATFEQAAMAYMIRRCAELHMHQIAHGGDPFETGSARPLDFGHWAAHKLESITHHELRHGEAVAIGIALDSRYSVLAGLLPQGADDRICFLLEHLGFSLWHPALKQRDEQSSLDVLRGLQEFKEHLGGELTITLLEDLGTGVEVHEMDEGNVREAIRWLEQRSDA